MSLKELQISHKKIAQTFVAYINFQGQIKDIPMKLEELCNICGGDKSNPAIAVIDMGVYSKEGIDIDVCIPIKVSNKINNINTKFLEEIEVLSIKHYGSHENMKESLQKLANYFHKHGICATTKNRLIFHKINLDNPEENQIEIQEILHKWDERLEQNLKRVLGEKKKNEVMKEREDLFTLESDLEDRVQWIEKVLNRLDKITGNYEKYEVLSPCAHEFPKKRINYLKDIYENTKDLNEVIKEMHKDYEWYEDPILKDKVIYVTKIPYNQKGYKEGKTLEEQRKSYCHCPLVRNHLDLGISPTFCNCSTGWYRQLWEGIIGKPVRIDILKTLIKGDLNCQFAIHLPL